MTIREHNADRVFLSIIIPAYNEEARIAKSLQTLACYIDEKPYPCEVVVVDDGSGDATGDIVREWAVGHSGFRLEAIPHGGKGAAVRHGMLVAVGERRFMCDADLAMPIERLDDFLELLAEGWDVVIGSRYMPGGKCFGESPLRRFLGRTYNKVVRLFAVRGLNDTQCGFKCFHGDAAEELFGQQRTLSWGFDVEILYLARRNGMRVVEIPVECYYDETSKVRTIPAGLELLRDIIAVRWRAARGVYSVDPSSRRK